MRLLLAYLAVSLMLFSCKTKKANEDFAQKEANDPPQIENTVTDEDGFIHISRNVSYNRENEAMDYYQRLTEIGYEEFYVIEREEYVVIDRYQSFSEHGFAEIIEYLDIPDTFNGKPVRIIGRSAFYERKIKTLKLPAYLEIIEKSAFWGSNVEDIIFNDTLKIIGEEAFTLNHVKNLIIPDSVTRIDGGAFSSNRIENLIIGNGIKTISEDAFFYGNISTIILPETLEIIEELAFSGNPIVKIIIPDNVYRIGQSAFSTLNEIIIGDNVELDIGISYTDMNRFIEFYIENNRRGGKYIMEYRRVYDGAEEYWTYHGRTE